MLVKPAGMVVHPAPGHAGGTLVNALLAPLRRSLSGIGGVLRPGIVHRLDKEVSGVMVVAKHDRAHVGLAGQFTVHAIERVYEAHRLGRARRRAGTRRPARSAATRSRPQADGDGPRGRQARGTHWRLLEAAGTRAAAARVSGSRPAARTRSASTCAELGHPIARRPALRRGSRRRAAPSWPRSAARPHPAARAPARLRASDHRRAPGVRRAAAGRCSTASLNSFARTLGRLDQRGPRAAPCGRRISPAAG